MTPPAPTRVRLNTFGCASCEVGRRSGLGRGQFCPFITREVAAGQRVGVDQPPDYVWFVRRGIIALEPGHDGESVELVLPGGFFGRDGTDLRSRRAHALTASLLCGATREGFERWLGSQDEVMDCDPAGEA